MPNHIKRLYYTAKHLLKSTVSPEYSAFDRLSEYEQVIFAGVRNGGALMVHHSESHHLTFTPAEMPSLIMAFQKDRDFFLAIKKTGVEEIKVPTGIYFHKLSARFMDRMDNYNQAKSLKIDAIVQTYDELIEEFGKGMRAVTVTPGKQPNEAPAVA